MNPLDQRILAYCDLPEFERAEVEQLARSDPKRAALLAQAQALSAVLAEARAVDDVDATALAEYVVAQHLRRRPAPPEAAARYARVEQAIREHPELEREARALLRTMERITADAEDPVAQFERLAGRHLSPAAHRPATAPAPDRGPARPLRLVRTARFALAACVGVAALYGALAFADGLVQPERARLADLAAAPGSYEGLTYRGETPDPTVDQYARALERLDAAEHSTLGLFPRYDATALDAVAGDLTALLREASGGSWEVLEAAFLLGRIRLHQGRDAEAAAAFRTVVEEDGPSAPEARRLLDWLARRDAAGAR